MAYQVKTRVFEGPLDLLLQLITSRQVDVADLSLVDLVDEYVAHLAAMERLDLEVTSEFLLVAATLIQLKVRRLLPDESPVDLDEELALAEERDRLLSRLLACLTYKDVAAVLAHRLEANGRFLARTAGLDPDVVPAAPPARLPVDAVGLARVAARARARDEELDVDHLDLERPSVEEAMEDLRLRVAREVAADFEALVTHCGGPREVIAYFLALLELARWGVVAVEQERHEAPIAVRYVGPGVVPGAVTEGAA